MTSAFRVLIPLDGSEFSEKAFGLVDSYYGSEVSGLALLQVIASAAGEEDARSYLEGLAAEHGGDRKARVVVRQSSDPAEEIVEVANEYDLVAMMTRGRGGLSRWLLGSVAERVARHCDTPLLLGSPDWEHPSGRIERILVPLDGSAIADQALDLARPLARRLGAELVLFSAGWVDVSHNVAAYSRDVDVTRVGLETHLAEMVSEARSAGVEARSLYALGHPAHEILEAMEETESDLLVMTTHGRTGLKRWVLGSVAEKVLRASTRPVLLARATSVA